VRIKLPSDIHDIPDVGYNNGIFWQMIAIVYIIACKEMRDALNKVS
jgi:hypothetical protein